MPEITFVLADGSQKTLAATIGQSLMLLARDSGIPIEGACDGNLACATCHVVVDPDWFHRLPAAKPDELDMLDLAYGLTRTSRLCCQIKVTEALHGLVVYLPSKT